MTLKFDRVAKQLGEELAARGYTWRLDDAHDHPRLYVGVNGTERFMILSRTDNYDAGTSFQLKRQDLRRLLAELPEPLAPPVQPPTPTATSVAEPGGELRSYPVKLFLFGAGGTLAARVPAEVVPTGKPRVSIAPLTGDGRFTLIFGERGTAASAASATARDTVTYFFKRNDVPFSFARRVPKDWKSPPQFARLMGDALVWREPLPPAILTVVEPEPAAAEPDALARSTLDRGANLVQRLNRWLAWAEADGHEPRVIIENGRVAVTVTERTTRRL